jgi:Tfp pilus assembly protein PilF
LGIQGNDSAKEAEYREALRLRPDSPEALVNIGNILLGRGQYVEAEAQCRQALRLHPDFPEAYVARIILGRILQRMGRLAEAEAECREALRLRPDFPDAHGTMGTILTEEKKPAEAEAEYRDALRLRPDYSEAHVNLGILLAGQGKHAEAARHIAEAFAANPKLANNLGNPIRCGAARYAALAGCGQGDGAKLADAERARLRRQALDWLRADLSAWDEFLVRQPEQARARAQQTLRHWQQDADFAGLRGASSGFSHCYF